MAGGKADAHAPASDWWPYRNQMLVALAAMKAISFGVNKLYSGTAKSDGSHRDGTPEFITAIYQLMVMPEGEMTVKAPAIDLSTTELVRAAGGWRGLTAATNRACHAATAEAATSISRSGRRSDMEWIKFNSPRLRAEPGYYQPFTWPDGKLHALPEIENVRDEGILNLLDHRHNRRTFNTLSEGQLGRLLWRCTRTAGHCRIGLAIRVACKPVMLECPRMGYFMSSATNKVP